MINELFFTCSLSPRITLQLTKKNRAIDNDNEQTSEYTLVSMWSVSYSVRSHIIDEAQNENAESAMFIIIKQC